MFVRALLLLVAGLLPLVVRAGGPVCFDLPCTVECGKYVVEVETAVGPRRFVFDTGATRSCISRRLCRELELSAERSGTAVDFEGHRSAVDYATVPRLRMGRAEYADLRVAVLPDSSYLFRCLGLDGVVGGDLLQAWAVRISAADSTIALAGDARLLGAPERRRSVRFVRSGNRPVLRLQASNGAARARVFAVFDSGSAGFFDCCDSEFRTMVRRGILRGLRRTAGHSGNLGWTNRSRVREVLAARIPRLELAGSTLDGVPVETICGHVGKLGLGILCGGRAIIDYPRRRFYLLPCEGRSALPHPSIHGVEVALAGGRPVVGRVWDETLEGVVAPGDRIVRLGSIDVERVDPCALLRGEICGDRPEMTVERQDGSRVVIPVKIF